MKKLYLIFEVHQPMKLKTYRFFDIKNDHYYYDDFENEYSIRKASENSYIPANSILRSLIKKYGNRFRFSFLFSGVVLDLMELYSPEGIESFREVTDTGNAGLLSGTYSRIFRTSPTRQEFVNQVKNHKKRIKKLFGNYPDVYSGSDLVYSDNLAEWVKGTGIKTIIVDKIPGVPDNIYSRSAYSVKDNPKLRIYKKNNFQLGDLSNFLLSERATDVTLLANDFLLKLNNIPGGNNDVSIVFLPYEIFDTFNDDSYGIFKFLENLVSSVLSESVFSFGSSSELNELQSPETEGATTENSDLKSPDLSLALGNTLQNDALERLYSKKQKIIQCTDPHILKDWYYLQSSDNFYYMGQSAYKANQVRRWAIPYDSPYMAYINYMNILSDFSERVDQWFSRNISENRLMHIGV